KVTSSGSEKEVDVIDFGGGSVSNSVIELHNVTTGYGKLIENGNLVTVNGHQAPFYFFPGDASITLPAAPLATAVYSDPLTAVRTVLLPSDPLLGHRLRVERKSTATGGGVNFAAAGNLAVGTFAELVYNGSSWVVAATGTA
uniref:hypothetical protein n=1 Tax=Pseudomonas aeruginosa TaxID=287 RepID=UPI002358A8AD